MADRCRLFALGEEEISYVVGISSHMTGGNTVWPRDYSFTNNNADIWPNPLSKYYYYNLPNGYFGTTRFAPLFMDNDDMYAVESEGWRLCRLSKNNPSVIKKTFMPNEWFSVQNLGNRIKIFYFGQIACDTESSSSIFVVAEFMEESNQNITRAGVIEFDRELTPIRVCEYFYASTSYSMKSLSIENGILSWIATSSSNQYVYVDCYDINTPQGISTSIGYYSVDSAGTAINTANTFEHAVFSWETKKLFVWFYDSRREENQYYLGYLDFSPFPYSEFQQGEPILSVLEDIYELDSSVFGAGGWSNNFDLYNTWGQMLATTGGDLVTILTTWDDEALFVKYKINSNLFEILDITSFLEGNYYVPGSISIIREQ